MKYMVMETHPSYCVVMDEAGRFIKAANFGYAIGQSIEKIHEIHAEAQPFFRRRTVLTAVTALAAILILVLALHAFFAAPLPYASVYLKINPEVRIDVSRDNLVVGLEPLNEDGAALLRGYSAGRQHLDDVTDDLIERAIDLGFLSEGGGVSLHLDSKDESWFENTQMKLRQSIENTLANKLSVTITISRYEVEAEPVDPQSPGAPRDTDADTDYESEAPDDNAPDAKVPDDDALDGEDDGPDEDDESPDDDDDDDLTDSECGDDD